MKVVIMAGGKGSRLSEETVAKPKPMVEIGDQPILWHIMMHYAHYDFKDFVIALGYKGEVIKKYMVDYCSLSSDLKINLRTGHVEMNGGFRPDWNVELIETGLNTGTGGRLKKLAQHLGGETCMMTWGDGVADVNLEELIAFHRAHGKLVTMTAVRPPARYGHLELDGDRITEFSEKPQTREGWINGAFFVVEPGAIEYIRDDETMWEQEPLQNLARDGQLMAYRHASFWQCMDTLREKHLLETLWASGNAPWKIWE
jgi:glucose-1-phosphate cytidylyltransferase